MELSIHEGCSSRIIIGLSEGSVVAFSLEFGSLGLFRFVEGDGVELVLMA
jgi:hypothetical protein